MALNERWKVEVITPMTTPKEALRPFAACVFNDNGDVTIDTSHLRTQDYMRAKSAIASLQGEDAVERVKALAHRFWSIHPSTIAAMNLTREEFYTREMMALLATGLVPDEAAVRADEREKIKDLSCESLLVMSDGYLNNPADDNVRVALSNAAVLIFGKERALRIRAAIRSGGGE